LSGLAAATGRSPDGVLTSLKNPSDIISVPPKFVFTPTINNYTALVIGEQH
jgi:hypothetical protein